jgi:porin-like protein
MKKSRKLSALTALGSLTAAVALLAGLPDASAQPASPGGGSFPGSFLVPGTNTSIKIGGFVKIVGIEDFTGKAGETIAVDNLALKGSANYSLNHALQMHPRQSNINFDTRTPTAYGDLTTFILFDSFGQNTSQAQNQSNAYNPRLVYAYGTLGPFLAGQWVSLFADTDAIIESVDPTGFIGNMDGLSNRAPQFRYTFAAPGGFSAAVSIENPEADGITQAGTLFTTTSTGSISGIDRYPDFVARARIDQAWGHIALSGMYRDLKVEAPGFPRESKASYAGQLSGHLNTFGQDALKATLAAGKAPGRYLTTLGRDSGADGLQVNTVTGATHAPFAWTANVGYTHWWAGSLRSSIDVGYGKNQNSVSVLGAGAVGADKRQTGGRVNLIWSPVPQVDLGVEYNYDRRVVQTGAAGNLQRLEIESVFKF